MFNDLFIKKNFLEIQTFGNFDIRYNGNSIFKEGKQARRIQELLKYFIAFKGKMMLIEEISEKLWPEKDYTDPKNVIKTQIFRMRKFLNEKDSKDFSLGDFLELKFASGFYVLEIKGSCFVDYDLFEEFLMQINSKKLDDNETIYTYLKALSLYKGDFMSDILDDNWVVPLRNYYRRRYIGTLYEIIEILKNRADYIKIIELVENAIMIEPLDEDLNVYFIEALIEIGKVREALEHYSYYTTRIYRELRIKPSEKLQNIYNRIQKRETGRIEGDISTIGIKLTKKEELKGPLFCDRDYFSFLYRVEKRRSDRNSSSTSIGMITIINHDGEILNAGILNIVMDKLKEILLQSLRSGDVITMWNDSQAIMILPNLTAENYKVIENRIRDRMNPIIDQNGIVLKFKFNSISMSNI